MIGTSSQDDKLARAAELGMDDGINYTKQDVVEEVMRLTGERGVDLVYEHVGGELFQHGLDSLSKDGRLVTCGAHSGEVVPFDIIPFFRTQKSIIGSFVYTRAEVERCLELARQGKIEPVVAATFPLEGEDWFEVADESRLSWREIVATLEAAQQRLSQAVSEIASGARISPLGEAERFDVVIGITGHAAYHAGQIQLLKKLID